MTISEVRDIEAFVVSCLNKFLTENPTYRYLNDDLKGEGCLAAVKVSKRTLDAPLLAEHIREAFISCVNDDMTIRIPDRTLRRYKGTDKEIVPAEREGNAEWEHTAEQDGLRDPRTMVDLWDEILGACETKVDRTIVEMRRDGYKDKEIADHLGTKQSSVQYLRKKIDERFKARQTA